MQQILVYGDSLSWGIVPGTRQRHPFDVRWPGVMEAELQRAGHGVRVLEDCLNGRRTVFEDPYKAGRMGLQGLAQRIEMHSPLALVIIALGTNDFQSMHPHVAWHAQQGMATLVGAVRAAPIEPGMPVPPVMIVAPPPITRPAGAIAPKFEGGQHKCQGLAEAYQTLAADLNCTCFDAGQVVASSPTDGVHLDAAEHLRLGHAMAAAVAALLAPGLPPA